MTCDCEDCGEGIEICGADGLVHPDAEVVCSNCGAVHVVQVDEDNAVRPGDVYLSIIRHGAEEIAALRKLLAAVVDEAEHGWHYASDYFREKWRDGELLDRARKAGLPSGA